ncbi:LysM domain-containing protein [Dyella sp. OK004]|uniref:LysM peptidoglycan-binding domain-containing protein n=1 Tax=Dyella sp. OK004 TaxID=1855292 RepID=UPI0008EDF5D6|nr:LysM domain-containing protein [Dyella sp. OK004]SFS07414.1 LysM domain-containing protein [Dyella sp. OK004]
MTYVAPSASATYTQPQLPPPQTYTSTGKETVTQVAQQHGVTPEELARTNGISVDSALSLGQVLTLPPHATALTTAQAAPAPQTPAQKTDAAIAAYQAAVKEHDDVMRNAPHNGGIRQDLDTSELDKVDAAKKAMDQAIGEEIAGQVALRNQGVPMEFRTPTDQLIASAGNTILARHAGDPALTSTLNSSIHSYTVQSDANALIPEYSGDWSPTDKLKGIILDGQPPEVVDAVLADPRVQGWIKDAASQVDQPYNGVSNYADAETHATDAAQRLLNTVQGLPPPLAAAVVNQSMPTIQKIAQCEMVSGGEGAYGTMQRVVSALGEGPQAQDLANQIAGAYVHQAERWAGFTTDATKFAVSDGASPTLAMALANALRQDGKSDQADGIVNLATQGLQQYLANGKDSPLKAYEDAHGAAEEKDKRLSQLLANAGPLDDDQKKKFVEAYTKDPDNAKVYQADADAAKNLASYMDAHKNDLLSAAGNSPDAAKQLYQCMKDLTQSGQGKTALEFADAIKADSPASQAFSAFSDYESDFLPKAIASAQGQLLVEEKGDSKTATDKLLELAEPLFKDKEGWASMKENYQRLGENENKAFDPKQLGEEFAKLGPAGKGLAMASVMVSAYNGGQADNITAMIGAYSMAGGNAAGLASGAVQYLADAGKLGRYTESAQAFAQFSARFVPGLAVIASTASFATDFNKLKSDPVYAGAVVGDLFSVMGSVLETTGAGEVPGAFLNGVGFFLSAPFQFVGGLIDGNKEASELHKEVEKYLGKDGVGLDDPTSKALAQSDPDQVKQWLATGISPDKLQDLAKLDPNLLQSEHGYGPNIVSLPDLEKRTGLSGDDMYNMLMAANGNDTSGAGVSEVMHVLGHPGWFPQSANAHTRTELAASFLAQAQSLQSDAAGDPNVAAQAAALNRAADWLQHN